MNKTYYNSIPYRYFVWLMVDVDMCIQLAREGAVEENC